MGIEQAFGGFRRVPVRQGLRLGELIRLAGLEPEQDRLFVYGGKGEKNGCSLLSPSVRSLLNRLGL